MLFLTSMQPVRLLYSLPWKTSSKKIYEIPFHTEAITKMADKLKKLNTNNVNLCAKHHSPIFFAGFFIPPFTLLTYGTHLGCDFLKEGFCIFIYIACYFRHYRNRADFYLLHLRYLMCWESPSVFKEVISSLANLSKVYLGLLLHRSKLQFTLSWVV